MLLAVVFVGDLAELEPAHFDMLAEKLTDGLGLTQFVVQIGRNRVVVVHASAVLEFQCERLRVLVVAIVRNLRLTARTQGDYWRLGFFGHGVLHGYLRDPASVGTSLAVYPGTRSAVFSLPAMTIEQTQLLVG